LQLCFSTLLHQAAPWVSSPPFPKGLFSFSWQRSGGNDLNYKRSRFLGAVYQNLTENRKKSVPALDKRHRIMLG